MNTDNLNLYKVWAPDDAEWTAWAKPVLFADAALSLTERYNDWTAWVMRPMPFDDISFSNASTLKIPEVPVQLDFRVMIIVDLPGQQSVEEALAFAGKGYRPVPLYNGTTGSGKMLVNVREVGEAILSGTDMLKNLSLPSDSPPVFMLDSSRMNGARTPGSYDNRWCVFPQDMPSAAYIKSKGIDKIIVRTEQNIQTDLERILYDYQKSGIALYVLRDNTKPPKELTVKKQSVIKEWAYRFKVVIGLKRNATGGFGGKIPDPYESGGSGGHYYRYG